MNPFIQQLLQQASKIGGGAFNRYYVQTMRNMGPSLRRSTGMTAGPLGAINTAARKDPGVLRSAAGAALAAPGAKPYVGTTSALIATGAADQTGLTGAIETGLNQVGPALDRFFGAITPAPIQQFGRQQEQKGWGGILEVSTPLGFALSGLLSAGNSGVNPPLKTTRPVGTRAVLNDKPVVWSGSRWIEQATTTTEQTADQATFQGAPPAPILPVPQASSGGPAERSLQREKIQAAAQVATNPLMQQWEAAKQAKDYEKADDLGMQIWQSKYGKTPIGQPGGALGTYNPLMQSTFGYQANMSPSDIAKVITNPSPVSPQPSEASIQMGDLGTRAMADTGYDPSAYGITPEQIEAIKEKLLAQAKK